MLNGHGLQWSERWQDRASASSHAPWSARQVTNGLPPSDEQGATWKNEARDALVSEYAALVPFVVSRSFSGLPGVLEREDLEAHGMIGLLEAARRYDPGRGVKFSTFAIPVIRASIISAMRALGPGPRGSYARARQVRGASDKLAQELGRQPTAAEVGASVDLSEREYRQTLVEMSRAVLSLDSADYAGDERHDPLQVQERLADPTAADPLATIEREDLLRRVADAVSELPAREREVLALYYDQEQTLREIGRVLSVSESRAGQLQSCAIARLRKAIGEPALGRA